MARIANDPRTPVLVVDDDPALRTMMTEALDADGYAVQAADSGAHALELLRRQRPAVIILDLMMPVIDGWAFIESYRDVARAEIPIVAVSAAMSPRSVECLRWLGVQASLAKPFDLGELLERVAEAVEA